jgi:tryptophan-rich hypothetical protein
VGANVRKLLHSKWTAAVPQRREKHFVVTAVVDPPVPGGAVEFVEIEAVMTRKARRIPWRELDDATKWRQGWI